MNINFKMQKCVEIQILQKNEQITRDDKIDKLCNTIRFIDIGTIIDEVDKVRLLL